MDGLGITAKVRVEGNILSRIRQIEAVGRHIRYRHACIILDVCRIPGGTIRFKVHLVYFAATSDGITALAGQLIDTRLDIVVSTTHIVIPTVSLAGQFQSALLPDVVESE